jgi:L-lactate permease
MLKPDDKVRPKKKPVRILDEFVDAHPRTMAFLKLVAIALCICMCYMAAKGDARVKVLVETLKDTAEVYTFLAMVLILLKKLAFSGSNHEKVIRSSFKYL